MSLMIFLIVSLETSTVNVLPSSTDSPTTISSTRISIQTKCCSDMVKLLHSGHLRTRSWPDHIIYREVAGIESWLE